LQPAEDRSAGTTPKWRGVVGVARCNSRSVICLAAIIEYDDDDEFGFEAAKYRN